MFWSLMSRGSLFLKVGPETRKLRGPKVTVFVRGMMKSPRAAERRVERPYTSDTRTNIHEVSRSKPWICSGSACSLLWEWEGGKTSKSQGQFENGQSCPSQFRDRSKIRWQGNVYGPNWDWTGWKYNLFGWPNSITRSSDRCRPCRLVFISMTVYIIVVIILQKFRYTLNRWINFVYS